jgi:hypothetical protein
MSVIAKEPPKKPSKDRKWKDGASYRCTLSKSPGYRVGRVYKCFNVPGVGLCLEGSDGFNDPVGMLESGFVECGP